MEGKAVMLFFIIKDFNPRDIHAELASVSGANAFILRTLYKRHRRFAQERTEFLIIRGLSEPDRMISSMLFALCSRNIFLLQTKTLCPFQACEAHVSADIARHFTVGKVQFMLSSTHSRSRSKIPLGCTFFEIP
jgi:hypothetical protein